MSAAGGPGPRLAPRPRSAPASGRAWPHARHRRRQLGGASCRRLGPQGWGRGLPADLSRGQFLLTLSLSLKDSPALLPEPSLTPASTTQGVMRHNGQVPYNGGSIWCRGARQRPQRSCLRRSRCRRLLLFMLDDLPFGCQTIGIDSLPCWPLVPP